MELDSGKRPACLVKVQYPAPCVGMFFIECHTCHATMILTAAGRKDDPKSVMMPCRKD